MDLVGDCADGSDWSPVTDAPGKNAKLMDGPIASDMESQKGTVDE